MVLETLEKAPYPEVLQNLKPLHNICEFLNAIHMYADEASQGVARYVESNHFCSHVNKDLRQCLIYDSPEKNARLIGVEYMIPPRVYDTLPAEEQRLWHSHNFEVKSGMLVLPKPPTIPEAVWEKAELEAMQEVIGLYGKTWHFWQVDRGDELPLGRPVLMGSTVKDGQVDLDKALKDRDERFGIDYKEKRKQREGIPELPIHENADSWVKRSETAEKQGDMNA